MAEPKRDVLQPVDDAAIALARSLLRTARFGALATLDPQSGAPRASRTATATDSDGTPLILVSKLAPHTSALEAEPRCSLLVGEPGRGDPLAHPRISLACEARRLDREAEEGMRARRRYLNRHPKAALYADFADFSFFRLDVQMASLNGGFARAFALERHHLVLPTEASIAIAEAEQAAIDHMNTDHSEAVDLLSGGTKGRPVSGFRITGIDPEGFDVAHGDEVRRVLFASPMTGPGEIRSAFTDLIAEVRGRNE